MTSFKDAYPDIKIMLKIAAKEIEDKYNCELNFNKARYSDVGLSMGISFVSLGDNGESSKQVLFNKLCENYGFTAKDFNKDVVFDNKVYHLVGFNPKARKNFCIVERDGKQYVISPELVTAALNKNR